MKQKRVNNKSPFAKKVIFASIYYAKKSTELTLYTVIFLILFRLHFGFSICDQTYASPLSLSFFYGVSSFSFVSTGITIFYNSEWVALKIVNRVTSDF